VYVAFGPLFPQSEIRQGGKGRRAMREWLIRLVARVPATIHAKLLAAFLVMVVLLVTLGIAGLYALSTDNRRAEELGKLQQKIAAYRELQRDALVQNDNVSTALMVPTDSTAPRDPALQIRQRAKLEFEVLLRQVNLFRRDFDRLQSVVKDTAQVLGPAPEESRWLSQILSDDDQFIKGVTHVVDLVRRGNVTEGRDQLTRAAPLADQLELSTGKLVVLADADLTARIKQSRAAYMISRWLVIGFAVGSIGLALVLGYVISWSLIGPVKRMDVQLKQITSGDFSQRVVVQNRDELGALAANLNRMSEELGRLYQQLEGASRHKSEFLANMSHELRTPLNAVLGYTELILDEIYGEVPDKIREVLERVQNNGRHLLGLINDVLDLSRIEAGHLSLSLTDYSMKDIVQTVSSAVESLATEKKLALTVAVPPDLPRGNGDERRITQVLLNLVGNAIKFTETGEVAIRASASDGQFLVAVSDTGPGISEKDQERIFEAFQQGDSSSTRTKGGTGLGLSIAKRIVEMHGGHMWVESNVGKGSTFLFALPILAQRHAEA
jgi:signal transduction histidine kinase